MVKLGWSGIGNLGDGEVMWGRNCEAEWKMMSEKRFFKLNPASVMRMKVGL
jgi:hypothetical protein